MISNQSTPLVLCVGSDQALLEIRRMVLTTRYNVEIVASLDGMELLLEANTFRLLILCHTVPHHQCEQFTALFHRMQPGVPVLALYGTDADCTAMADSTAHALDGPRHLFRQIDQLLAQSAHINPALMHATHETTLQ